MMDFPKMAMIRQVFHGPSLKDIPGKVSSELSKLNLRKQIQQGSRVGITAGSRGIKDIAIILRTIIDLLKDMGAHPFIFPAMGSHGGATAEGQTQVLAEYMITEASMGVSILSSMDVKEVGKTQRGIPVLIDRYGVEADFLAVVNRIKPHTKFKAPLESGLFKMMVIGMGKDQGAQYYHKAAIQHAIYPIILEAGKLILSKCPILFGLGIVENVYDETALIEAIPPHEILEREQRLLEEAKKRMPKIPFEDVDILIVDEIGKDISGTGMDTNITGRNRDLIGDFPHAVRIKRIFVRDLSEKSNGNAIGIGFADFTTKRLVEKIDLQKTYTNCLTGISPEKGAIPIYFSNDREALEACLNTIGMVDPDRSRILHIRNTLKLDRVEVSEAFREELSGRPDLTILSEWKSMKFDLEGNLLSSL
jgi:hypothetical protein